MNQTAEVSCAEANWNVTGESLSRQPAELASGFTIIQEATRKTNNKLTLSLWNE
jgi:hypothetical protein